MHTSGLRPVTELLHKQYTLVVILLPKVNSCITDSSVERDSSHVFCEAIVLPVVIQSVLECVQRWCVNYISWESVPCVSYSVGEESRSNG